jgi:uncharacterized protein YxeA
MTSVKLAFLSLIISSSLVSVFAQTTGDTPLVPLFGDATGGEVVKGNVDCFDYYHFGSVISELSARVEKVSPDSSQMKVIFTGNIKNANPYPLVDLDIYVKISRRQKSEANQMQNAGLLVDQFTAVKGLVISGNSEKMVTFTWMVPNGTVPGNYELGTYAIVNQKYNLSGLSFTDDVVGGKMSFIIPGTSNGEVEWDKNKVMMNGIQYHFAAFIPQFTMNESVKVDAPLMNLTKIAQQSTITWKQYNWDGQREGELLNKKEETVTLSPGEKKSISYTATKYTGAVTYLVADVETSGVHSILDMRFARQGVTQARINFPSLMSFPLKSGKETTIFSCLHSVGPEVISGGKLVLSLTDENGKVITEDTYEGKIGSAMMGNAKKFIPTSDVNKAILTATLSLNGKIIETNKTVYDCAGIDPTSCTPSPVSSLPQLTNNMTVNVTIIGAILVIVLLLVIGGVYYWKRRSTSMNGTGSTPPSVPPLVIFLLISLFGSGLFGTSSRAYALSTSVSSAGTFTSSLYDTIALCTGAANMCNLEPNWNHLDIATGWPTGYSPDWIPVFTISGITSSLYYEVNVQNASTLAPINNGDSIVVGTTIQFVRKAPSDTDITWNGTGGFNDSPYGHWGAGAPVFLANTTWNGIIVGLYVALNVAQPTLTITHGGTATLNCINSGWTCTVMTPGTITSIVNVPATTAALEGSFTKNVTCATGPATCLPSKNYWYQAGTHPGYFPMQDSTKVAATGCNLNSSNPTTCSGLANANKTVVSYPATTVTFNFLASATPCAWGWGIGKLTAVPNGTVSSPGCDVGVVNPATVCNATRYNQVLTCVDLIPDAFKYTCSCRAMTPAPTVNLWFTP